MMPLASPPTPARISASVQDYLKAIYTQTRTGQPTSTMALAEALAIRPASVTNMLQKLAETQPGLLVYRKHYGVSLTPEGERVALQIIRRHRLIEQFLFQVLEYPLDQVHHEAEELEHVVSPFFVEKLAHLLDDPAFDPHGDPIPDVNLNMDDPRALTLLAELPPGARGVVRQITDQSPEALAYLHSIGISPGAGLQVEQVNPIDGALQVRLSESGQTQVMGAAIAAHIQVEAS